jgi:regulator of replication initiation timing
MTNEFLQQGSFNIGVQDNHAPVNVTQILGKSAEYKDLLNQLETQRELFAYIPEDKIERRLQISQAITQLEAQIEQFKQDVTKLAQEFNRIEINTDRLRRAKAHFEQGEIAAARAVFDSEREQMQDENDRLVREKERYEQDVLPKLKHNSEEFYLRALLERTAYDNPDWLADTCEYFERSINAMATEDNVFGYAVFLQNHNRFNQSELWYQKCLDEFASGDQSKRAMTLNNLANLHSDKNELAKAEAEYVEALQIGRELAIDTPAAYSLGVARTLINLARLHAKKEELERAREKYIEVLKIYLDLAAIKRFFHLPDVATTLNNLAVLHGQMEEFAKAETELVNALQLQRDLATFNPTAYMPNLANTIVNFAFFYQKYSPIR